MGTDQFQGTEVEEEKGATTAFRLLIKRILMGSLIILFIGVCSFAILFITMCLL